MSIYLEQLGVGSALAYAPDPKRMPAFFSTAARNLWRDAAMSVHLRMPSATPHQKWQMTVQTLLQLAEEARINPFRSRSADNTRIIAHLRSERNLVVKFLDKTKILKSLRIRQGHRSVSVHKSGGFVIEIDGTVEHNRQVDQLIGRYFRYKRKWSRYYHELSKHTVMTAWNEGAGMSNRWHLAYTISCPLLPALANTPLPTRNQLEQSILKRVWPQVADYSRPFGNTTM